jgi:hypothetical protein
MSYFDIILSVEAVLKKTLRLLLHYNQLVLKNA